MILSKRLFIILLSCILIGLCAAFTAAPAHASYLAWSLATDGGSLMTPASVVPVDDRAAKYAVQPGNAPGTTKQSNKKIVYLTFDDGPSQNTQKILNILDQYHAKATFFVTDQEPKYDYLIKTAYKKGHTIGLHSSTHEYSIYRSEKTYFDDLNKIGQTVKKEIGYVPAFVRFPGGSSNTISRNYAPGIMHKLAKELNAKGYQYYDWNADCTDGSMANGNPNTLVTRALQCKDNNIVLLCHDTEAKSHTVDALPRIIQGYQKRGYVFKAITNKSFAPHHQINN